MLCSAVAGSAGPYNRGCSSIPKSQVDQELLHVGLCEVAEPPKGRSLGTGEVEMGSGRWEEMVISASALSLAGTAGWLDWRVRKIPNWLTVPALLVGLIMSLALGGMARVEGILGRRRHQLGCAAAVRFTPGLGCWRLEIDGGAGRFSRPEAGHRGAVGYVLIAGLMSVVEVIRQRKVRETLNNIWVLFVSVSTFQVNYARTITLDNPGLLKDPIRGGRGAFDRLVFRDRIDNSLFTPVGMTA